MSLSVAAPVPALPQSFAEAMPVQPPPAWLPLAYLVISLFFGSVTAVFAQKVLQQKPGPAASWTLALQPQPVTVAHPALKIALAPTDGGLSRDDFSETTRLATHVAHALVADELGSLALKISLLDEVGQHVQRRLVSAPGRATP